MTRMYGEEKIFTGEIISIARFTIDPFTTRDLFIKAGSPIQIAYTDDGKHYNEARMAGKPDEYVLGFDSLLVIDETKLFIGTSQGRIFRSQNAGENWIVVEDGVSSPAGCTFIRKISDRIMAAFQNGTVIWSLDHGNVWHTYELLPFKEGIDCA